MTSVVVLGPNLIDQSKGSYHVHKAGCQSLGSYYGAEHAADKRNVMQFDSEREVAEFIGADFIGIDGSTVEDFLNDIHFHSCVSFKKEVPVTTKITFELFNEELFLIMEIDSVDVENDLTLLRSVPNVRNISVS